MRPEDFDLFAAALKQRCGLALTLDKAYLLESRLPLVARKRHLKTIEELASLVRTTRDEGLLEEITEAMSLSESAFFRDQKPFEFLRSQLIPQFLKKRAQKRTLRVWAAGVGFGQEAYSLAIDFAEINDEVRGWRIDILATDFSRQAIEKAQTGIYSQFEIQRGLPIRLLLKYADKVADDWQIKADLRSKIEFRKANLLRDFGAIGVFDIVFCRNLVSYFDQVTKLRVLNNLASVMAPDGVLCLGKGETADIEKLRPLENAPGFFALV